MARQENQGEPPDPAPSIIQLEARRLAEDFLLSGSDETRAAAFLERLHCTFRTQTRDQANEVSPVSGQFPFSMLVEFAQVFGFERAIYLLEREDLASLARRMQAVKYLFAEDTPLYTLSELADHARAFADFLKTHRAYMVRFGLPPRIFDRCPWLYIHLARLYDTRATTSPYPHDEWFISPCRDAQPPPYRWIRALLGGTVGGTKFSECEYHDADLIGGMDRVDVTRIENDRARVFEVKLQLVELLARTARRNQPNDLWTNCVQELCTAFNAEEIEFYFRMDRFYIGADAYVGLDSSPDPRMTPGGLTNLLEVIGHFEKEMMVGTLDRTKSSLPGPVLAFLNESSDDRAFCGWDYLKVIDHPDRPTLDALLDDLQKLGESEISHWTDYRHRVREAITNEFRILVPVEVWPRHVSKLRPVLQIVAEDFQKRLERNQSIVLIPERTNTFRRDGDSWTLDFAGKQIPKRDAVGYFYIAHVLARPQRHFTASELRRAYLAYQEPKSFSANQNEQEQDELSLPSEDAGEILDAEAEKAYRREIQSLEARIDVAQIANDGNLVDKLQNDLEFYKKEWKAAHGLGGRLRKMSSQPKRDLDAVRNAIERVMEDLRNAHKPLAKHLDNSLKIGPVIQYDPETTVDWDL